MGENESLNMLVYALIIIIIFMYQYSLSEMGDKKDDLGWCKKRAVL